jgi:ribosomal protein S18 acetylase RimI-like enzyme
VLIQNREITHPDVTLLVRDAEDELIIRYPDEVPSSLDSHMKFVVAYVLGRPVGCAGLVLPGDGTGEIKRIFVQPGHRRTGIARRLLHAMERRATAANISVLLLETGAINASAIALYESAGFERTEPFGEYVNNPASVCFKKKLDHAAATGMPRS